MQDKAQHFPLPIYSLFLLTCNSLLVTSYLLLLTCYFLLVTYSLLLLFSAMFLFKKIILDNQLFTCRNLQKWRVPCFK